MFALSPDKYHLLSEPLKDVSINTLFARAVVDQHVHNGTIYVDDENSPKVFYVIHPYKMTLLFGDSSNEKFNSAFKEYALNTSKNRTWHEWMQAYPSSWNSTLEKLFGDKLIKSSDNKDKRTDLVELNTRVNFKFNIDKYHAMRQNLPQDANIVRTDKTIFEKTKGSVIPTCFWDSAEDFCSKSIGFTLIHEGEAVSTAFCSCKHGQQLEIGIETMEKYRGKGYAQIVCAALIEYCLENGYEPVWACRLENTGSYILAQKVGFEPSITLPYYKLPL